MYIVLHHKHEITEEKMGEGHCTCAYSIFRQILNTTHEELNEKPHILNIPLDIGVLYSTPNKIH